MTDQREPTSTPVLTARSTDQEILLAAVEHWHATLFHRPRALAYLERRSLRSDEMLRAFMVGYSDGSVLRVLPKRDRPARAELRRRLQQLGVIDENGREVRRGAITLPVLDERGDIVGVYGRRARWQQDGAHLWLGRRSVLNWDAVREWKTIILTGSFLDALSLWAHGHRNVIGLPGGELGEEADELLGALTRHGVHAVTIALGNDERSICAAEELCSKLLRLGVEVWAVELPEGYDLNDVVRQATNKPEALDKIIRCAVRLGRAAPTTHSLSSN